MADRRYQSQWGGSQSGRSRRETGAGILRHRGIACGWTNNNGDIINIRLVAVDLDGTLLDNDKQLPPHGSRLIKHASERGVHIIISTTRNYDVVRKICTALAINEPLICSNGAFVYSSPGGALWRELYIPIPAAA